MTSKNAMYFLDTGCVRTLCHLYGYVTDYDVEPMTLKTSLCHVDV